MDDYILKILSRQGSREEAAPETVWEKPRYISRETDTDGLRPGAEAENDEAAAQTAKRVEMLWTMFREMEPLTGALPEEDPERKGRGQSDGYISPSLSRLSGIVFGRRTVPLTPESLSMFYQRDARRFS